MREENEGKKQKWWVFIVIILAIISGLVVMFFYAIEKQTLPPAPEDTPKYKPATPKYVPQPMNIPDEWTLNGS